jgi:fumarate reductase flavoprotein subunit
MAVELGGHVLNGDLASGPEIRFVAPPRRLLVAMIPPVRPIARIMSLVANRLRDSWLRPMITSFITSYLGPSPKLYQEGAVLVNRDGNRFVDELSSPAAAIAAQPGNVAYIVFDARVAERFTAWPYYISTASGVAYAFLKDYRRNRRDIYKEAPTLEGLAQAIGVPVAALTRTIAEYNGLVDGNKSDALGRGRLGQGLRVPPFYALGPAKAWIAITDGGLAVSSRMEVLTATGKTIPGLYAAGSAGQGGAILEAHGLRLCWAFTSGRIAGRSAADG